MLTSDSADRANTFKVAFLTVASIFIMGYLNGLALNTYHLGTMISAQSGNIIWLGLNAAGGYWGAFIENLGLFFGFAGGVAFALLAQNLFKDSAGKFFFNWTVFIVPIIIYPLLLQYTLPPWFANTLLGFACGAALGFFRKMYHLEINNAMATGSARFVGLEFVNGVIKKDKTALFSLLIFIVCLLAFAAGAGLYGLFLRLDSNIADGIRLGIGSSGEYSPMRLGHGVFAYLEEPSGNMVRIIGLVVICLIPYCFCPTNFNKSGEQ